MKKEYNNLDIKNLIKTEWFNQFDMNEKYQITEGLKNNLDVSLYTKKEFDCEQMKQIREGLEQGLDVSIYAKLEYNDEQMWILSWGLKDNLDVSIYANPKYSWKEMNKIRMKLLKESTLLKWTLFLLKLIIKYVIIKKKT